MAVQNGTAIALYIGTTKIANLLSNDFSVDTSLRDTTTKDSGGWAGHADGLKSWKCSAKGYFENAASYGFSDLFALQIAGTSVTAKYTSNVTGEKKYSGTAYISGLSQSADLEKTAEFSVSLTGSGAVAEATNP